MKKGQTIEFLGIAIFVLSLVLFLLFTRLSATNNAVEQAEIIASEYQAKSTAKGPLILLKTTIHQKSLFDLLGDFTCYGNEIADYGTWFEVNVTAALSEVLDPAYGAEYYSIQLKTAPILSLDYYCYHNKKFAPGKCKFSSNLQVKTFDFVMPLPCSLGDFTDAVFYTWEPE